MNQMISYAQNGEDIILKRLFGDKKSGSYIDIGASHPEFLSVTKHFYDMGWRGINVDPLKNCMDIFAQSRPDDLNLNVAIDREKGFLDFYEITDYPELSTFSAQAADFLSKAGHKVTCYPVERITGNELFDQYVHGPVDFLKIDVEGREYDVISSIDFHRFRPTVLVIEATIPNATFPGWRNFKSIFNFEKWEQVLLNSGYILAYFDGLNRFYLSRENESLMDCFQVGLCLWDDFALSSQVKYIAELEWQCAERMKHIETLTAMLQEAEADRAARWEQIEALTAMLKEAEAGRAAMGGQVEALTAMLQEAEAGRAAMGGQVEALTAMLREAEAGSAARGGQIEALTAMLQEAEAGRAARDERVTSLLADLRALFARPVFRGLTRVSGWPEVSNLLEQMAKPNA